MEIIILIMTIISLTLILGGTNLFNKFKHNSNRLFELEQRCDSLIETLECYRMVKENIFTNKIEAGATLVTIHYNDSEQRINALMEHFKLEFKKPAPLPSKLVVVKVK